MTPDLIEVCDAAEKACRVLATILAHFRLAGAEWAEQIADDLADAVRRARRGA